MFTISRFPRQFRLLLVLGICLLITGMLPAAPAAAAKVNKRLDDKLQEFTRGTLQRTSLSAYPKTSSVGDAKGAVQLMPVSVIRNWTSLGTRLPKRLTDHAATSVGNVIFVLGGLESDSQQTNPVPTDKIWSIEIDPATGAPPLTTTAWTDQGSLPNVVHSNFAPLYNKPDTRRTLMAVTSVTTSGNNGFIYVMGGRVQPTGAPQAISSFAVDIATVVNGKITGWSTPNLASIRIPADPLWGLNGLQSASAVTHKIGSNIYIYLIGGLERFQNGLVIQEVGSKQVYYARVRTSDGMLIKPSNGQAGWDTLTTAPIPIPSEGQNPELEDDVSGLWDATVLAGTFEFGDQSGGTPNKKDVMYVMGGQYQSEQGNDVSNVYSNAVYRAFINSNGTLTWTSTGPNQWEGTLPQARISMGGVEANGKLYLTGGRQVQSGVTQPPEAAVLTSIVEDDFTLLDQGGSAGSNFIYQEDVLKTPISPRARHGSVKIQLPVTDQDAAAPAYVYVVGGVGIEEADARGTDTLIFAKIGGDEDVQAVGFPTSGWYYSTIHETNRNFSGEQVQEIDWTTLMTDSAMDIEMQYRISTDNECSNPVALNNAPWQNMDGVPTDPKRSKNGANAHVIGVPPPTHCFQYRARLVNGTGGIKLTTPLLLNVSIQVIIPGSPDLKVMTLKDLRNGKGDFTGLNVQLVNHYDDTTGNSPTQSADVEQLGGSFFVDLLVFGPGETEVPPPATPWTNNPPGDKACVSIPKSQMPADAQLTIQRWYSLTAGSSCNQTPIDVKSLFTTPGNYVVYVVVDSYQCSGLTALGCVDESSQGAETNNIARLAFTVDKVGIPDLHLPFIGK